MERRRKDPRLWFITRAGAIMIKGRWLKLMLMLMLALAA